MCLAADVPLIESGTTGFQGQVQPIVKVAPPPLKRKGFMFREKQNVMIVIQRRFRNRFPCVLFVQRPHNLSTVSYGLNLTSSLNSLVSMKKKSLK
jgi:hypothetical protein